MDHPDAHTELVDRLVEGRDSWRTLLVAGASDAGKTTFAALLGERLTGDGPAVRVDCDIGQSTIGPPATVGAASEPLEPGPSDPGTARSGDSGDAGTGTPDPLALRFVGSTSPSRHFLPLLTGVIRLVDRALAEPDARVILDDMGYYLGGGGSELHHQLVDAVLPDHLVALQRQHEVERLLDSFERRTGVEVHRLPVAEEARERSRDERRRYRRRRFARHFEGARRQTVDLSRVGLNGHVPNLADPRASSRRLLGLCGEDGSLLSLACLDSADPDAGRLEVLAPGFDPGELVSVSFGSLRLEPEETGESRA